MRMARAATTIAIPKTIAKMAQELALTKAVTMYATNLKIDASHVPTYLAGPCILCPIVG